MVYLRPKPLGIYQEFDKYQGEVFMATKKVRVAIIGVGNCASSLVQGVEFYKDAKESDRVPGLMHVNLGGYHIRDIEFSAAFDVVDTKVRKAPGPTADIVKILRDTKTDVVVSYLPVGSEMATKWYVEQVLEAGCGFVHWL